MMGSITLSAAEIESTSWRKSTIPCKKDYKWNKSTISSFLMSIKKDKSKKHSRKNAKVPWKSMRPALKNKIQWFAND